MRRRAVEETDWRKEEEDMGARVERGAKGACDVWDVMHACVRQGRRREWDAEENIRHR